MLLRNIEEAVEERLRRPIDIGRRPRPKLTIARDIRDDAVAQADIDKWLTARSAAVNPTTRDIERRALHAIFNFAKTRGYIDKNPFSDIPKVKIQEKRLFMTTDELYALFHAMREQVEEGRTAHVVQGLICGQGIGGQPHNRTGNIDH